MARVRAIICVLTLCLGVSDSFAQTEESDLRIFGYFQSSFQHWTAIKPGTYLTGSRSAFNSFSVQQLNMFFQKDLARHWRAFINFEVLNNFSSSRQWGSMNLEEAWVRYRYNEHFNLKFGLLIPIFNHLNEIKNRTPLLPYVIRPLVYESSFSEFIAVEEYIPARAFVQAYGFLPSTEAKLDYAVYLGNSPNINDRDSFASTGVDTTATFLFGGRVGFRYKEFKLGVSATYDQTNILQGLEKIPEIGGPPSRFQEVPRIRLGGDGSYHKRGFSIEGEFIVVRYDDDAPGFSINKKFLYGTLGYHISDPWFVYAGYWFLEENDIVPNPSNPPDPLNPSAPNRFVAATGSSDVFTAGMAYNLNDRVTLKAQYGRVDFTQKAPSLSIFEGQGFDHLSVAASVFF